MLSGGFLKLWTVVGIALAGLFLGWAARTGDRPLGLHDVVCAYLVLVWFAVIGSGLKMNIPYLGVDQVTVETGFILLVVVLTIHALLVWRFQRVQPPNGSRM